MKKLSSLALAMILFGSTIKAQNGYLRGAVVDDDLGEALIGANVYVEGTTVGSVADYNGDYSISLMPGTYNIIISSVSYSTVKVTDVKIEEDQVTSLDVTMKTDIEQLEGIIITAAVIRDSEAGLLTVQKKALNIADGISYQSFVKNGDSDLSGAIKRVTGVTVENGKYVSVRGLGDRYTKTTLNGMTIPGLDPDRNSVQIDIFPTAVLNNVMVYKTFTPNLSGDFTGGVVDIETRNFPEIKSTTLSVGLTMTPGVQFNNNFILYRGGNTDWLGFDDGTRALPFNKNTEIPAESQIDTKLEQLTRSFNPQMAAQKRRSMPGGRFTFNTGNQINGNNITYGYNMLLSYSNTYQYFSDIQSNNYLKDTDKAESELFRDNKRNGALGRQTVNWSALVSGALKFNNHSFSLNLLRSQSGESNATARLSQNFNQTGATLLEDILTYTQRSVTNAILIGKHNFKKSNLEWRSAMNWSKVSDPDFRITSISVTDGDTSLNVGDGAGINRFYRDLNEFNSSLKVDYTIPYAANSKLRFGGLAAYKERDFEILNYLFRQRGNGNISSNPDWFLQPENVWTADSRTGTYLVGNFEPTNSYNARQTIFSAYAMTELYFSAKFKSIFGVRAEQTTMFYSGQTNSGDVVYTDEKTLDNLDLLPSLNLVYSLSENVNFRGSFNKTLARPSFKEKSIAQIYDPLTNRTFVGNIDLLQTNINNYDLRWEYFMKPGEILSISGFYKTFINHIELVSFPVDPDALKPRNAANSWVYGAEIELRKNLSFISSALENLSLGSNFSIIRSFVDMTSVYVDNSGTKTEKQIRAENARDGEVITDTRPMAGQAPFIVNAFVNYNISAIDLNINFAYNVQGAKLAIVGSGAVPDVYTVPFHSLSFNVYKGIGLKRRSRITFGVDNLLGDIRQQVYQSYQAEDQVYATFNPGTEYSLKYSFTF